MSEKRESNLSEKSENLQNDGKKIVSEFGKRLQRVLDKKGYTRADIANMYVGENDHDNLTENQLHDWYYGIHTPTRKSIQKLQKVFPDIDFEYWLGNVEYMNEQDERDALNRKRALELFEGENRTDINLINLSADLDMHLSRLMFTSLKMNGYQLQQDDGEYSIFNPVNGEICPLDEFEEHYMDSMKDYSSFLMFQALGAAEPLKASGKLAPVPGLGIIPESIWRRIGEEALKGNNELGYIHAREMQVEPEKLIETAIKFVKGEYNLPKDENGVTSFYAKGDTE